MVRSALLASLLLTSACNAQDEARSFADVSMETAWSEGLPGGVDTTQLHSDFTADEFPGMDFDGSCSRAFHVVARDEPRAYWIRCQVLPGMAEFYLYEMRTGQVTQAVTTTSTLSN